MGKQRKQWQTLFFGAPKSLQMVDCSLEIKRHLLLGKRSYDQPRQHVKKQRYHFANKEHLVKAVVFPVVVYGCESWTIKKAERQRIDAFELWCWRRLLRVPWTAGRSNQSILKEISPEYWIFIERNDAEAETPILWPSNAKNWLIWKDPDAGKDRRWEEKGLTEDEMVGWCYWLSGHGFV